MVYYRAAKKTRRGIMDNRPALIFDMDGTLWDSSVGVARSWTQIIKKEYDKNRSVTREDVQSVMGLTMDVIAHRIFPELKKKDAEALLEKCTDNENRYLLKHGGRLYPHLVATLDRLKENYRLFIVSNCQSGYIECFLDHYGLRDRFEDIECYGNNLKKKGANIKLICKRNGIKRALYVGDIQGDYNSACEAGVGFIHASYGFGTIDAEVPAIKSFRGLPGAAKKYFGE